MHRSSVIGCPGTTIKRMNSGLATIRKLPEFQALPGRSLLMKPYALAGLTVCENQLMKKGTVLDSHRGEQTAIGVK